MDLIELKQKQMLSASIQKTQGLTVFVFPQMPILRLITVVVVTVCIRQKHRAVVLYSNPR